MSSGTIVLGLLNGLTIGLLATGLVLVYKANRFINLAHAQMGALSALLLGKWVLDWGLSWWVSFALAVTVGTVTGLVVERYIVRPLRRRSASPISLLLITVGASQVLLGLTFVPALGPSESHNYLYPQPFTSHLHIGYVLLSGMSVLTMILVPSLVVAMAAFLRYTSVGKQIRAAASNADAARLCGVSVQRVSVVTWALAGGLAAVSAVLEAPSQASFNVASLGPYLLMLTLGAAAFGAFVSLPAALGGGVVLGLVYQIVAAETSNGSDAELAVFGAILVVILVRGRLISRVFASSGAPVPERSPVRIPEILRGNRAVTHPQRWLGPVALVVALAFPQLPYFDTDGNRFLLSLVLIYAVIGVALTMLIGWGGQVSLGHFAVVGIGAYLAARWAPHGWNLPALLLVCGLIGAGAMVVVGLPALRVRGLTLAVTTLGLAVVAADWLFLQPWVGSANPYGVTVPPLRPFPAVGTPQSQQSVYYAALVVLALVIAAGAALRRSAPGRLMVAVRDDERTAATFGVTPATVKLSLLAVSGFIAAMGGVLWADAWRTVAPSQFTADVSIAALAVAVVGGLGSLAGAAVAAAVIYLPAFFVGPLVSGLFGNFGHNLGFQLFLTGAGQIGILQAYPTGLAGMGQSAWQRHLNRRAERMVAERAAVDGAAPLAVDGAVVHFGGVVALDGASIEVRPGEIVGLIGPNGAGKTTLINVISGAISPAAGSVRLFGQEVVDLPSDLRPGYGLGRSFQSASLFAGLTVTETVKVALARHHKVGVTSALLAAPWVRRSERTVAARAREIVERLGLTPWADSLTAELSTGTRRICDLAAQVAAEPRVLVLDEPTAGIAQREAEAFGPLLRRIRDELDCAILIVEHDMPLLMSLCDRVYAMEAGKVIAEGPPEQIRNDPAVVASYLGTDQVAITRSGTRSGPGSGTRPPRRRAAAGGNGAAAARSSGTPSQGRARTGGTGR